MAKTTCIMSAPSKEELEKMINNYYFSKEYFINDDYKIEHKITGKILNPVIVVKNNRWQVRK